MTIVALRRRVINWMASSLACAYCGAMSPRVIVLNGGSSSGKSSIARRLQETTAGPWLAIGVDDLVDAMPSRLREGGDGIDLSGAEVGVGQAFRALDVAWSRGVGEMARQGAHVIIDDVFLGRAESQQRWREALAGVEVGWVGVRCDPAAAEAREAARGDRIAGMAASQADTVHDGVAYDVVVDTATATVAEAADAIAAAFGLKPA